MKKPRLLVLAAAIVLTAGCNVAPRQPVITQGVFGEMRTSCDSIPCTGGGALSSVSVSLFSSDPRPTDGGPPPTAVATTLTDGEGFFEIAADAGTWFLGSTNLNSTQLEVSAGKVARWTFTAGPGGGRWTKAD